MPAELARRFERRSRTYEARALPTELHQHKTLEVAGRIALPMICFAGRRLSVLATPPQKIWSGVRELHPCFRTGDPGYCSYTNSAWSEQRELNSRHRVGDPRHQPLYHARFNKHWRSQRELNPSLLIDNQASCR